jgi:hypothetical protein
MGGRNLRGTSLLAVALALACAVAGCGTQAPVAQQQRGIGEVASVAISRVLGSGEPRYRIDSNLRTRAAGVEAKFSARQAQVRSGGVAWTLSAPAVRPVADRNRVSYVTPGLREWFASGPLGLEQGYTITRPSTGPTLTLPVGRLPAGVGVRLSSAARDASLVRNGRTVLRYGDLTVIDQAGRSLPARIVAATGRGLAIRVDVRGARYPVTVDPLVQSAKLTSGDTGAGLGAGALAISGDTIAAGAWQYPNGVKDGAVYVFVKPAGGWSDMTKYTARLTNGNANGENLGQSVAIDGDTIVAGAHGSGYADVFVKSGASWSSTATPTAVLSDSSISGNTGFGKAVAVSGSAIAVGDPADGGLHGLVDVFVRSGTTWSSTSTPTERLTDSTMSGGADIAGSLGTSLAMSAGTIAAGAPTWRANNTGAPQTGAVLEFTAPAGGWGSAGQSGTQTAILTPSASSFSGDPELGGAVAVDGPVIVGGATSWQSGAATPAIGAAYVWTEAGSWTSGTQTAVLTPSDGTAAEDFGSGVALSGSSVAVGAPYAGASDDGATYLFRQPTGGWANATETQKLTPRDAAANAQFGGAVALTGTTVAAAANPGADGSVYVFGDAPLSITTSSLPDATSGTAYSASIAASGGTTPYSFSASGLPAGLSINASSGAITGTPTAIGAATPTFTVTDAYGQSASRQIELTVFAAPAPPTTTTTPPPTAPPTTTPPTTTTPGKLTDLSPPQINGTLAANHTLTCTPGAWSEPGATFAYAWFAIEPAAPAPKLTIKTKAKVFGLKSSKNAISDKLESVVPREVSVPIANGPSYAVGFLDAPESVYCQVSATLGAQSASANSSAVAVDPGPPQLAGPSRGNPRPAKPHIQSGIGVGGTNTCSPGDWQGNPTFSYAWVTVAKPEGKILSHLGSGATLQVPGEAEDELIECKVRAESKWGAASAWTNSYVVAPSAPQSNGTPHVAISTQYPGSDAVAGAAGGIGVAEVIDLTCEPGGWNRDDLSYSYIWTDDRWSGYVQAGQTLHLSMRPGQLQFDDTIHCQVTATTPHGLANTAQSGQISVWNGCTEWYADVLQTSDPVDTHIGGPEQWLRAVPEDDLFDYDESAGTEVKGAFGFAGGDLAFKGPYANGEERPSRAETDGPNCADYQKYLRGQGYDVKQGPNPEGDQFWIEHGNPFF